MKNTNSKSKTLEGQGQTKGSIGNDAGSDRRIQGEKDRRREVQAISEFELNEKLYYKPVLEKEEKATNRKEAEEKGAKISLLFCAPKRSDGEREREGKLLSKANNGKPVWQQTSKESYEADESGRKGSKQLSKEKSELESTKEKETDIPKTRTQEIDKEKESKKIGESIPKELSVHYVSCKQSKLNESKKKYYNHSNKTILTDVIMEDAPDEIQQLRAQMEAQQMEIAAQRAEIEAQRLIIAERQNQPTQAVQAAQAAPDNVASDTAPTNDAFNDGSSEMSQPSNAEIANMISELRREFRNKPSTDNHNIMDGLRNEHHANYLKEMERKGNYEAERSRRHRGLIYGMNKLDVARNYLSDDARLQDQIEIEQIERHMEKFLIMEEKHENIQPRVGNGYHYLQGRTPFWREPWPKAWRVVKPWEFVHKHDHQQLQLQLETLKLEVFNGDRETYTQWQKVFYKTIHIQDMDIDLKYNWLMRHLSEDVKQEMTRGIGHAQSKYCMVICRLEKTYSVIGKEVDITMDSLTALKPFKSNETKRAVEFMQRLQGYLCACDEADESPSNRSVMHVLRGIIPREWWRGYISWIKSVPTGENPETLYAHLEPIVDVEEEMLSMPSAGSGSYQGERKKPSYNYKMARREPLKTTALIGVHNNDKMECHCCGGPHRMKQCHKFYLELNNEQRRELLEKIQFCLKCFTSNHPGKSCLNKRQCTLCRNEHSSWVHTQKDDKIEKQNNVHFAEEETNDDDDYDGLSGECVGQGFGEEDGVEEDVETGLTFAAVTMETDDTDVTNTVQKKAQQNKKPTSAIKTKKDEIHRLPGRKINVGLQQALINIQNPETKTHMTVNALIDSGSNHTAISKRLADKLAVDGLTSSYKVITFGGGAFEQESKMVRITMRSVDGTQERTLVVRSVSNLCGDLKVWNWNEFKGKWKHLRDVSFPIPVGDYRVDVLLGTDNSDFARTTRPDVVGRTPQEPILRTTTLGNIAMGLVKPWTEPISHRVNLTQAFACSNMETKSRKEILQLESDLYWDLKRLFAVEHKIEENFLRHVKDNKTIGLEQAEAAEKVHESRTYLTDEKKYQVGIPWKDSRRPKNNLWSAIRVFKGYLRSQQGNEEAVNKMTETIDSWIKSGYARILNTQEIKENRSFIIPSFVVTRIDKTSTQHRLVINAAKEFDGKSLNDYIAKTPDVMNELYSVLLNFRKEKYTYTADIQHMFLQVLTNPDDRRYLRILYQPIARGALHVVECSRHMFGLRSSPYVAIEVIKTHAYEQRKRWPRGYEAISKHSIVDDVLVSLSTEEELLQLHKELEELFAEISMKVHKCASNSTKFMTTVPQEQRAKQVRLEDINSGNPELMPVIKALGMVYDPEEDEFRFEYSHDQPKKWTLRSMVSAVAKLYDPLGLVAPFLMSGRAIVQIIWMSGKKWDDVVDEKTSQMCSLWLAASKRVGEHQNTPHVDNNERMGQTERKTYCFFRRLQNWIWGSCLLDARRPKPIGSSTNKSCTKQKR